MREYKYILTKDDEGSELKDLLKSNFKFSARLRAKIKREKLLFLNGEEAIPWLSGDEGDVLSVRIPSETSSFEPENIPVSVIYEDEDILAINKQPGYICHPTKGHPNHTMANGIMKYVLDTNQEFKIRFINRLDMDTSGILMIAKNTHSQADFMNRQKYSEKRYIAIVNGFLENENGIIDLPIGRPDPERVERGVMTEEEGGLPSLTHYKVLDRYSQKTAGGETRDYTLVEVLIKTGRTHQIRVHMSYIGHPVLGDYLYGGENVNLIERQALHAYRLAFDHPVTGKRIKLEAPLPDDILETIRKLKGK